MRLLMVLRGERGRGDRGGGVGFEVRVCMVMVF